MDNATELQQLAERLKQWGNALGFQQIGITDVDLTLAEQRLQYWLERGFQGTMSYLSQHGSKRSHPEQLVPGTVRVISARMDYLPVNAEIDLALNDPARAYISRYALGRDYHKVLRQRLKQLAQQLASDQAATQYRVFTDSAPVLEKPLAEKAGLGWIGKHTNLINKQAGSWFFLGEIYTNIPLPIDTPAVNHCGQCRACLDICPTQAIVAPYQLDARRCISYLTIEYKGPIPLELRPLMGNRIYGCDDCQQVCPWNRFARPTQELDFAPRHRLDQALLIQLLQWSAAEFDRYTEGSALRRAGYASWRRNIAIALGNSPPHPTIITALQQRLQHDPSDDPEWVREAYCWALAQQQLN